PRARSTESTGPPSSVRAAAAASLSAGSRGIAKNGGADLLPILAVDIAARRTCCREQDAPNPVRKSRIGENLLEVVDEVGASERTDPRQLARAIVLEEHVIGRNAALLGGKNALLDHPAPRRLAQIDVGRVKVAIALLVADDEQLDASLGAAAQEVDRPGERDRVADAGAIDVAL